MIARARPAAILLLALLGAACERGAAPASSGSAPVASVSVAPPPVASATASAPPVDEGPSHACDPLPLLGAYRAGGAIVEQSAHRLKLALTIDLHSLDCGAPDAYGEKLSLELQIAPQAQHCWLRGGTVTSKPFTAGPEDLEPKPWSDELRVEQPVDLALLEPQDVVLRGIKTSRALLLQRFRYWLFDDVKPGAPLRPRLAGEEDDGKDCCFGFTSAAAQHWEYEHAHSAFSRDAPPNDESERTAFNTWATHSGLRHHLEALVRRGFRVAPDETVSIDLLPLQATVRLSDASPATYSPIAVLQFSRKPCTDCQGGFSGWWLWGAEARWWCPNEKGTLIEGAQGCP